jgi:hypothetical protein
MRVSWKRPARIATRSLRAGLVRCAAVGVLVVLVTGGMHTPQAGATNDVSFSSAMNGQPAATSSDAHPAQLYPDKLAHVHIRVSNNSSSTLHIATVRFEGQVVGLPLFSFDTGVNLFVPPGDTKSLTFPVALTSVGSQATGLIVATITLIGTNGGGLASQSLVTDVHGSLVSVYGLFGLAVLVLTALSLALALLSMARHTLPQNRWLRGVRFLIPGFGVGLVLTFTLSAFDIFAPSAGHWLPLLVVPTLIGLLIGFLTPAPNEEEFDDYDEDVLLAQIVVVDEDPLELAGSRSSGDLVTSAAPGVPDSRATTAPGVPDSRATTAPGVPDSRATPPPGVPDSRPTEP